MSDDPVPNPSPYLDPQNQAFLELAGKRLNGKQLTDLSLRDLRAFLNKLESPEPKHPDITVSSFNVKTTHGEVKTFVYKPKHASSDLPFVYYLHGGVWIVGNAFVYSGFIFDLIERANFEIAVVFPQYTLAPAEKFPVQQEQCLDVLQWLVKYGGTHGLATHNVAVMADSAGGRLTAKEISSAFVANTRNKVNPQSRSPLSITNRTSSCPSRTRSCSTRCSTAQSLVHASPSSSSKTARSTVLRSSKKPSRTTSPTKIPPTWSNVPA